MNTYLPFTFEVGTTLIFPRKGNMYALTHLTALLDIVATILNSTLSLLTFYIYGTVTFVIINVIG